MEAKALAVATPEWPKAPLLSLILPMHDQPSHCSFSSPGSSSSSDSSGSSDLGSPYGSPIPDEYTDADAREFLRQNREFRDEYSATTKAQGIKILEL